MITRIPTDLTDVTLAVLAGGSGQRMGLPKAWMKLDGKPILARLLERLSWPGPTMLVTAPGKMHPPGYELLDREVTDPVDGLGPLQGVLTALQHASTSIVAMVTVDMPNIDQRMLAWLIDELAARPTCDGLMCRVKEGDQNHVQPFPSVFRPKAAGSIASRLNSGRRSVRSVCDEPFFCAIDTPWQWPKGAWINLNTPDDLAAFESTTGNQEAEQIE